MNQSITSRLDIISDYINKLMIEQDGVGVSVAIVKGSDTIYSKGFGNSRIQPDNQPIDGDTVMSIQSISKNFMALSIMQLVENKMVSLDDPVIQHLPY
ncbi:serine hydrolase [Bacillus haikouensis]|nr:serine hydrolase [Bacillus haikouensis]